MILAGFGKDKAAEIAEHIDNVFERKLGIEDERLINLQYWVENYPFRNWEKILENEFNIGLLQSGPIIAQIRKLYFNSPLIFPDNNINNNNNNNKFRRTVANGPFNRGRTRTRGSNNNTESRIDLWISSTYKSEFQ